MQDPSQGVHRDLLPHAHLVSSYRFPVLQQLHLEQITKWLAQAPKICKESAPVYWTYLDRPVDGSIYLVWQPLAALGTHSASDGYVWAGAENLYQMEVSGGYILETYHFRTGFGLQESVATHSRKRYRLVPSRPMQSDSLSPDPSLFIIHYSACEPNDRVPANIIPLNMQIQQTMQTRAYLQSQGQIVRRDFMLHDRQSWPPVTLPAGASRGVPGRQQVYPGPTRMSQSMAYPPQPPQYQSHQPNKRPRPNPPGQSGAPSSASLLEHGIEEEEDTLRGDFFDQVTPREIAYFRYKQNYEWMEEIFSSPYHSSQIEPVDLGLGKPGHLGKLTEDIYEMPNYQRRKSASPDPENRKIRGPMDCKSMYRHPEKLFAKSSYVAKLDPEKAEEFRRRTSQHIEQTNAAIEKLKLRHAKKMAKFKSGSIISAGEKKLRKAVTDPEDVGPEIWRMEGRVNPDNEEYHKESEKKEPKLKVEDVVAQVQASLHRTVAVVPEVRRIQDGGFEERQEKPVASVSQPTHIINGPSYARDSRRGSHQSGVMVGDTDMGLDDAIEGQATGLLDQFHAGEAGSAFSNHSTPAPSFATPQGMLHPHSAAGTPSGLGNMSMNSPHHAHSQGPAQGMSRQHSFAGAGGDAGLDMDVDMGDATDQAHGARGNGNDDWIVVPPGGISPQSTSLNDNGDNHGSTSNNNTSASQPATQATAGGASTSAPSHPSANATASATMGADAGGFGFSAAGVDDASSAFDLGGADDGHGHGGDLDLGMDLGMDDSAFGEAFQGVEGARDAEQEREGEGGGMGRM